MVGSRVCGEYGDSPPIQPRFTASTANRINSLVKQHPVRKFRSAAPMLGSALPCLAVPGSLALPLFLNPLSTPQFSETVSGCRRPEDSARLWASLVASRPACRFVLETLIEASATKLPPLSHAGSHARLQGDAEFAPSVPGATASSGVLEFWEIGSRLHGAEGQRETCRLQFGRTSSLLWHWHWTAQGLALCGRTCPADMDTAAGL